MTNQNHLQKNTKWCSQCTTVDGQDDCLSARLLLGVVSHAETSRQMHLHRGFVWILCVRGRPYGSRVSPVERSGRRAVTMATFWTSTTDGAPSRPQDCFQLFGSSYLPKWFTPRSCSSHFHSPSCTAVMCWAGVCRASVNVRSRGEGEDGCGSVQSGLAGRGTAFHCPGRCCGPVRRQKWWNVWGIVADFFLLLLFFCPPLNHECKATAASCWFPTSLNSR